MLEPLWSTGPILPQTLISLIQPIEEELKEAEEIMEYDPDEVFDDEVYLAYIHQSYLYGNLL